MNTFLLCMNTERKINTKEHGVVRGLAVANVASCESSDHAKDYIAIAEGDHIIGCNSDGIRWKALIDEVVTATDDEEDSEKKGEAVRILKGRLVARGERSIAAASKRMKASGVALPDIFNSRGSGFRQGALAKLLTADQAEELESCLK
ncbi:MAG: hypothetical protein KTR33_06255 [Gammaproteobacteria bacterium]|nr:hypothetical protein [Gammaproteobacteria bacterium]